MSSERDYRPEKSYLDRPQATRKPSIGVVTVGDPITGDLLFRAIAQEGTGSVYLGQFSTKEEAQAVLDNYHAYQQRTQ